LQRACGLRCWYAWHIANAAYQQRRSNPATKKIAAIISINGKDEFVQQSSKLNGIRINTIKKDKIFITYLHEKYWIKKTIV
jgi:hypothetical protein